MKKVISFCVYGTHEKYLKGLTKNLEIINDKLPEFYTYIHVGQDITEDYINEYSKFSNVKIIKTELTGPVLMFKRLIPIDDDDVEICFSRDIDSRINYRDMWTINEFIKSDKKFHIIRDHYWHKMRIMGGCCGVKKIDGLNISNEMEAWKKQNPNITYGSDELFLREIIYPKIKSICLIHSNIVGYLHEKITRITIPLESEYDFIGNVVEMNNGIESYKFSYKSIQFDEHFDFLHREEQWGLLIEHAKQINITNYGTDRLRHMIFGLYMANYYTNDMDGCIEILKLYKHTYVDDHIIYNSNYIISRLGKIVVATTDMSRVPGENEIIIYYGNFYHSLDCLPISNKVYRHPKYFYSLNHHKIEFDPCWEKIDQIYILNLEERGDRYLEILVELCKMNVPLNRIYHYKAKKESITGNKTVDVYYGAGKNHTDVMKHFIEKKYKYCLILEDDFTFTSRINEHKRDLHEFLKRDYDFDVCMISASKYHNIKPYDDLLSLSYQTCTTTSGYIVKNTTVKKVHDVMDEGNKLLLETGNTGYTCDQYWRKIQKDNKFFLFNLKMGYQRPNFSSITGKWDCHFD